MLAAGDQPHPEFSPPALDKPLPTEGTYCLLSSPWHGRFSGQIDGQLINIIIITNLFRLIFLKTGADQTGNFTGGTREHLAPGHEGTSGGAAALQPGVVATAVAVGKRGVGPPVPSRPGPRIWEAFSDHPCGVQKLRLWVSETGPPHPPQPLPPLPAPIHQPPALRAGGEITPWRLGVVHIVTPRRQDYSTVTLLARFRGWSTSVPLRSAIW
jgi:hypothetical protein